MKYCCWECWATERGTYEICMFVCPQCGNKRCPRATDHNLPCSNSNAPGQAGSMYGEPLFSKEVKM